ncbi:NAD(P)/FAD-dependent oxidoreductase [Micromonospora endophytica]|uniref:Dehydrogenase n=1 Tax=Micromonospora endophytica TaxID=515350 RepID=A0A2W2D9H2_9ACTN|nr:FAD-dependent oxidoreductase [Micromonospora endophytica]PZG00539.1 dehydrogenase [Micromonospora endophytica]RIW45806.1 dehydrogenase [Micromonospora endophytica]BCJ61946.1 dehydrogenase [Micromonospora endophytica]
MKVVVVGAGYSGTLAANRLAKKLPEAQITVVNPRSDFVERVRLHQQLAGTGRAATPLTEMLREGIQSRLASVHKIGDGIVTLETGNSLEFDNLFLAVGSTTRPLAGTIAIGTWEGAEQARAALGRLPAGSTVTVIGAGLTGIETASEIAGARADLRVRLVGQSLAPTFGEGAQRRVRAGLERLNVSVQLDTVEEVRPDEAGPGASTVRLGSGEEFSSDLTLWAVLGAVPELAARSGLRVDASGRAVVDEHLRSVTDSRVFAIGDCAAIPGSRQACQTAGPQGAYAADTLAALVKGSKLKPYSQGYTGTALSIGRKDAVIQLTHQDDSPTRFFLTNRLAVLGKELGARTAKHCARTANIAWRSGPK